MEAVNIGSRREVCWDEYLVDTTEGVRVQMHKPEYRGDAMVCDAPWEGSTCAYFTVIHEGEYFRLYYRGSNYNQDDMGNIYGHSGKLCYALSKDGKTFEKISVGLNSFWGTKDNNILSLTTGDNISIFKDTNPNCPAEELYKGLCGTEKKELVYYKSADGVNFEKAHVVADDGAYDSLNVCFWDSTTQQYYLFYRGFHGPSTDGQRSWTKEETDDPAYKYHLKGLIRDVRVRTSKDFVQWSIPQRLEYGDDAEDIELYTNGVQKYYRANHMFVGFPMRYIDRYEDAKNYPLLPNWKHRELAIQYQSPRTGTAITDGAIMTSRDGVHFNRWDEAFITAGIERGTNWYYGDGMLCYGMAETASDIPGAPNEISMYMHVDYRAKPVTLRRYGIRLDGFFSWRCDFKPGKVVTKPICFQGDRLYMNFSTSAFGYVQIRILDADGNPLEGYDSGRSFGDSVEREVLFDKPISALSGKPVRLEISMRDADLYSFKFTSDVKI